jgi:hypothetical protein
MPSSRSIKSIAVELAAPDRYAPRAVNQQPMGTVIEEVTVFDYIISGRSS